MNWGGGSGGEFVFFFPGQLADEVFFFPGRVAVEFFFPLLPEPPPPNH